MQPATILETVFFGPLKATLDPSTGDLGPLIDRATGAPAASLYRPAYLAEARRCMLQAWACTADLA